MNKDSSNLKFTLRDRNKICYNKKFGGFVLYKQAEEAEEWVDMEE
jgi:hypothetical protein